MLVITVMRCRFLLFIATSLMALHSSPGQQLDVERLFEDRNLAPVGQLLATGDYELCGRICEAAIARGMKAPEWRLMRVRALMLQGQEAAARDEVQLAIATYPAHLELLMLQHENALLLGRQDIADQALAAVNAAAKTKPAQDRSAQEWVSLGQAALALGADAKKVIAQYFTVAQKKDPKLESAYLAEGHLALEKDDPARAADVFRAGLKAHGETAALRTGLAKAFANGDTEKMMENIARALEVNPNQAGARLMRAEMLIGSEKFLEAEAEIQKVLDIRENCPEAWALRAAVAQLSAAGPEKITTARARGLARWEKNPAVDHILGRVISRAYRFAEGAAHQRQALEFQADYLPAKVQLCHDLLRLGDEEEAWKLAADIRQQDGYNIQAHNIGQLEKEMRGYTTKSYPDFILKMPKRDWPIYGESALALLREAKAALCPKYGLELNRPVMVEFFGAQQDFAIRTFGSLGGQGLLGVCFGTVITMNSPGSLAHGRNNWESTLWHEFCHVVTLTLTRNKMPRWLSEGISVHEESLRNPAWGMKMNATFRKMILEDKAATQVSQLSSAFLQAPDEDHLMFAYYQSSQVVAYLSERFGPECIQGILADLASGKRINDAIAANTENMDQLEQDFHRHLKDLALQQFGALADWDKPSPEELNPLDPESLASYRKENPKNLWAIRRYAETMLSQENWEEVLKTAELLIQLVPEDIGGQSGYQLKADALGKLNRIEEEIETLRHIAAHEPGAMAVFLRLIEVDTGRQDWPSLQVNARRAIALNPFLRTPQQALATAAEAQSQSSEAIEANRRLLLLDPATAAGTHYRLARLLRETDASAAKRHLLDSLALAPRYRQAHALLHAWE
ncbi:tetratricopeptide repeat protein [Prosthecobacter sp. SYSU 5D2]|uniref:peptidase MA family metallohydrolase n=1 Tax=Prosthecobacter sp. SYSU 5D2 TaxID=3134134 RepID=UPI0031FEBD95